MAQQFDYFIILAGMRTGSNFLEENLNRYSGLNCFGEAFNPNFIGQSKKTELFGLSLQDREAEPVSLIQKMKSATGGLPGFRFFHDHDPRILKHCLRDPGCAKIVLHRNPAESYVSWEIARKTDQWRLGDLQNAKSARIIFDVTRFEKLLSDRQAFHARIQKDLQVSGQAAFSISYEDISDPEILNGLARFLGVEAPKKSGTAKTKKQNPAPLEDKVENYQEMIGALSQIDFFALSEAPSFEPRRGPAVPGYLASAVVPLLFMPIKSGPNATVINWLNGFGEGGDDNLIRELSQKTLRQWKRKSRGHRSFSVVSHPVQRLHNAYVRHILLPGPEVYDQIRETLVERHGLPETDAANQTIDQHRFAFLKFIEFVRGNLAGQTSIRVDSAWASQSEILRGMAGFMAPDHVLREDALEAGLAFLASHSGRSPPALRPEPDPSPYPLAAIYDDQIEAAARSAYQRDYMMFGFGPWSETTG